MHEARVKISVPATSANLGAGFDTLGIALDLRDTITVQRIDEPSRIVIDGEGFDTAGSGGDNLLVRAWRSVFAALGVEAPHVEISCTNVIPHARGLGSSAAAVVAGLAAARAVLDDPNELADDDLLQLATSLEGHPDNAAPALFGGATLAWMNDGVAHWRALEVASTITPVVFIPDVTGTTATSRATLPASVPFGDAVFNLQRVAMMTIALKEPDLLFEATDDRLHQPYRASVMGPSLALVAALREQGNAAVLSGAGPTVLSFTQPSGDAISAAERDGWRVCPLPVSAEGVRVI